MRRGGTLNVFHDIMNEQPLLSHFIGDPSCFVISYNEMHKIAPGVCVCARVCVYQKQTSFILNEDGGCVCL